MKTNLYNKRGGDIIKTFFKNFKIEIFFTLGFIIFLLICMFCQNSIWLRSTGDFLEKYLNSNRLGYIISIFSIVIGFYLTIATIVSLSIINVSKAILLSQSDKPILMLIMLGISENLLCVLLCTLISDFSSVFVSFIILYFLVISIITFIKFINFIRSLFVTNMKSMKEEIKIKEYNEQELFITLEKIEKNTRKQDK